MYSDKNFLLLTRGELPELKSMREKHILSLVLGKKKPVPSHWFLNK